MEAHGLVVELGSSSSLSGLSSFSFLISSIYFNFFFSSFVQRDQRGGVLTPA
jgi:hypothetical protein